MDELELGRRVAAAFDPAVARVRVVKGGGRKIVWRVEGARGAFALKRTPKRFPRRIRSGSRNEISSRIGVTIPYHVSLTSAREAATLSYSLFATLSC